MQHQPVLFLSLNDLKLHPALCHVVLHLPHWKCHGRSSRSSTTQVRPSFRNQFNNIAQVREQALVCVITKMSFAYNTKHAKISVFWFTSTARQRNHIPGYFNADAAFCPMWTSRSDLLPLPHTVERGGLNLALHSITIMASPQFKSSSISEGSFAHWETSVGLGHRPAGRKTGSQPAPSGGSTHNFCVAWIWSLFRSRTIHREYVLR